MADKQNKPEPMILQVGGLEEQFPELTAAERIPAPGVVFNSLWSAVLQLPSMPNQIVGELSSLVPDFDLEP